MSTATADAGAAAHQGTARRVLGALVHNPLAAFGSIVLLGVVVVGLLGPALAPYSENEITVEDALEGPAAGTSSAPTSSAATSSAGC